MFDARMKTYHKHWGSHVEIPNGLINIWLASPLVEYSFHDPVIVGVPDSILVGGDGENYGRVPT